MDAIAGHEAECKTAQPSEIENSKPCEHCGQAFERRKHGGGSPQRFCSTDCRAAFHSGSDKSQRSPAWTLPTLDTNNPEHENANNAPQATPRPSEDFDWGNDSSIILHEQPATAVYFNKDGSLVIRQHRWPDDDTVIFIAESSIADFLDKLTDVCGVPSYGKPG
jgi:hypothetical protein